ncbi:hypothetical protein QBZ16_005056 [Prototheca wickerhamii]|uniref:HECT-type E3 ubiquitin transferase n=1 Tax=Prototheca wickerhamii TaxID=3111 RepID=A0AAD9MJN9_PROWI|nr:hypothetical protein QBZ16_005056 [Prototheca wickerhamii]
MTVCIELEPETRLADARALAPAQREIGSWSSFSGLLAQQRLLVLASRALGGMLDARVTGATDSDIVDVAQALCQGFARVIERGGSPLVAGVVADQLVNGPTGKQAWVTLAKALAQGRLGSVLRRLVAVAELAALDSAIAGLVSALTGVVAAADPGAWGQTARELAQLASARPASTWSDTGASVTAFSLASAPALRDLPGAGLDDGEALDSLAQNVVAGVSGVQAETRSPPSNSLGAAAHVLLCALRRRPTSRPAAWAQQLAHPSCVAALVAALGSADEAACRDVCLLFQSLLDGSDPVQRLRLELSLAVRTPFLQTLWASFLEPGLGARGGLGGWWAAEPEDPSWMPVLALLANVFSSFLSTLPRSDGLLYQAASPIPLERLVAVLRDGVWLCVSDLPRVDRLRDGAAQRRLLRWGGRVLCRLFEVNGQRAFMPAAAFHVAGAFAVTSLANEEADEEGAASSDDEGGMDEGGLSTEAGTSQADALPTRRPTPPLRCSDPASRAATALRFAPCLIPFRQRAEAFQRAVAAERAAASGGQAAFVEPPAFAPVRRGHALEDGFAAFGAQGGPALRGRLRIQYISGLGFHEAGVDGGGLFKEFLEEVVREGFDPGRGLFRANAEGLLYPSPEWQAWGELALPLHAFLGKMLGKALLEGTLVELPLAGFFLTKLLGRRCDLRDLASLDAELAGNLEKLRGFDPGTLEALDLRMAITDLQVPGGEVELVPGGAEIRISSANLAEYVHRVADYRLNRQLARPIGAFVAGLRALIPARWLAPFSGPELQALISGGGQGIDVGDLAAHTAFGGGYAPDHPVIRRLWSVLEAFTPPEQALFLRFVTSCPRPPLLGFQYLHPPLSIQMSGSEQDKEALTRLPTASTCMNLLKLPPYQSTETLREKLRYAIAAGAGFELS